MPRSSLGLHRHSHLTPQLFAPRVATSATKQGTLPAGDDAVAAAGGGLGDEGCGAGVANLCAAHGR